jgi:transcription antitermination factor NusG
MPILSEEQSLYPETLLDELLPESSVRRWWALHTKPRQEKAVARSILAFRIPFYLPLVRKRTSYRGQQLVSHVPLFAGYVFVFSSEEERVRALLTHRIAQALWVEDQDRLQFDLRQFRQLILSDAPLTVEARLKPGNTVRVLRGPFSGLEGVVLKRRGQTRLLVALNFLQRGASVEIDDYLLEPIDPPKGH